MPNWNSIIAVLVFLASWNLCCAYYLVPSQQQPQYGHQGYLSRGFAANNPFSPYAIRDFEYVPTAQGYRYSYIQNDGFTNGENVITNNQILPLAQYPGVDAINTGFNAVGIGGRPKNRKLSPKSLQSLAG